MKTKYILITFLTLSSLMGCKQKENETFEVSGKVNNLDQIMSLYPAAFRDGKLSLMLYEVPFGGESQLVQLDSVVVSKESPAFTLKAPSNGQSIFDVVVNNGPMIPLVNDAGKIQLDIDLTNKDRYYTVTGSPASETIRDFLFKYSERSAAANTSFNVLDSLKLYNASDSVVIAATNRKNQSLAAVNDFVKEFLANSKQPLVAGFAAGVASNTFSPAEYELELNKLVDRFPSDSNIALLKREFEKQKAQSVEARKSAQSSSWIGKKVPELSMPDVNGKMVSISSFRGKYVLIDFWASWCGPCRDENPNLVNAYNEFKDRNFTVLGVSLDKDKPNWLKAIKEDKLTWTHMSDLAFWNSKSVEVFQFEGIPFNVLVDPEGTIIGEGLRGFDLTKKLSEVLK